MTPSPEQTLPLLHVPGAPTQEEIDRLLSSYEAWVYIDEGPGNGLDMGEWDDAVKMVLT